MAEPFVVNIADAESPTPHVYTVPGSVEIEALAAFAWFIGTAATIPWVPALGFYDQNGDLLARVFPEVTIQPGESAQVTFAPSLNTRQNDVSGNNGTFSSSAGINNIQVDVNQLALASVQAYNVGPAIAFLKFYNRSTVEPNPPVDPADVFLALPVGVPVLLNLVPPAQFDQGLTFVIVGGPQLANNTAVAANQVFFSYQVTF